MTDRRRAVTVVGSLHVDLIASADRLPAPGESLIGHAFAIHPGGKAGNQATQVALAGTTVHLVARLGDDAFGRDLRSRLAAKGVDLAYVATDPDAATGASAVLAGADGEYASIIVPGAAGCLSVADVDAAGAAFAASRAVMLQLEIPVAVSAHAATIAAALGATVVLNASPAPPRAIPHDLLTHVDLLVVNAVEAARLGGGTVVDAASAVAAGERLRTTHGVPAVVVTLGAGGAVAVTDEGATHQPAWPVEVVDTVGAGDAFVGALVAELVAGRSFPAALPVAAAAGALATTTAGAFDAIPTRDDIAAFLAAHAGA